MVVHSPKLYAKHWQKSVYALEEPMYNPSIPMYSHMNEVMSKHGIVVTLAGDMGDEILLAGRSNAGKSSALEIA